jgi:ELWxxDGT repeat protein
MKPLVIFFLLAISIPTFSQISFFKQLNDVEEGSYPSNFTEFKGEVYFTVRTIDGNRLWKTDGTEGGTVQVSDKNLILNTQARANNLYFNNYLYACNDELYFNTTNQETWKTDGNNLTKVGNSLGVPAFCINNTPIYDSNEGIYLKSIELNGKLIKFKIDVFAQQCSIESTTNNPFQNDLIGKIDGVLYFINGTFLREQGNLKIDNSIYFFLYRYNDFPINSIKMIELWKTDGVIIEKVKDIINVPQSASDFKIESLGNFNGKLIFLLKSKDLWISDGTSAGTQAIGNITNVVSDPNSKTWGIFPDKFCFAKENNGDIELWISDGTSQGSSLLKDIYPESSSNPSNFEKIGNHVFFRTSKNELWRTDGSQEGTLFVSEISSPSNPYINDGYPKYITTSDGKFYCSNYNNETGLELYKFDQSVLKLKLVKNIVKYNQPSTRFGTKIKFGNNWYFNGMDSHGSELWKTDGTPNGSVLVKDIDSGSGHTEILQMVKTSNLFYFLAFQGNRFRIFRSDGTENGTYEITFPNLNYSNVTNLVAGDTKIYFNYGSDLFTSDGSISGTHKVGTLNNFIRALATLNDKCFISAEELYISNGIPNDISLISEINNVQRPTKADYFKIFNSKVYFLGFFSNSRTISLFESNGTSFGTKIIKSFNYPYDFYNLPYVFLEKSNNRLYFNVNPKFSFDFDSFDLWTSDGTTDGTYFLNSISYKWGSQFTFTNFENHFYISNIFTNQPKIWHSEGTSNTTYKLLESNGVSDINNMVVLNNKAYFSMFATNIGTELWETDGTITGTKLTAEIRPGQPNSQINNLMNFDDKIIMSGTDGNGIALWQYLDNTQIKSIKSGNWDDPSTWNTGQVPVVTNNVTIDENHIVVIPAAIQANLFTIIIKNGGTLEIGNGSGLNLNKAN